MDSPPRMSGIAGFIRATYAMSVADFKQGSNSAKQTFRHAQHGDGEGCRRRTCLTLLPGPKSWAPWLYSTRFGVSALNGCATMLSNASKAELSGHFSYQWREFHGHFHLWRRCTLSDRRYADLFRMSVPLPYHLSVFRWIAEEGHVKSSALH